jgi:hypothetical protein
MTRDNKVESAAEKRDEYAYWAIPGAAANVTYSLPLFHEIDLLVNEGYRKIPHGGIEEGGLLFGKIDAKGTRIEAFRAIECEHASGPSFLLSEHDLEVLSTQLAGIGSDAELEGLDPIGWFLGHTRGPLVLTDHEVALFDHYFTAAGMLTVLVKPERFQPTRFGFAVRSKDGSMTRDASGSAIILPLPGRNARASNEPVASIPAPAVSAAAARRAAEGETRPEKAIVEVPPARPAAISNLTPAPSPGASEKPAAGQTSRRNRRLNLEQVIPKEEEYEEVPAVGSDAGSAGPTAPPSGHELEPVHLSQVGSPPSESALVSQQPSDESHDADSMPDPYRQIALINKKKPASAAARLVMVLPLAALLGCLVGYVAYLQVPSPIIPLTVKGRGQTVVVTWPAEETRSAVYAVVRVDDSTPVMLTPEERIAGRVEVTASADMKVELIARNWIHDSRGIVRFVKPNANTAP